MFVERIILFFKGEDMKQEMRYDIVARMHLDNQDELLEKKQEEQTGINVPVTNVIKEEKTTLVQPIIIQTDEEGRLKGVQYLNPNGQLENNPNAKIETQKDSIEALETKEEE
jgi:hypothetical protein